MKVINKPKAPSIDDMVMEYEALREQKKIITSRMDFISKSIKDYATNNGVQDDKGSYYCENDKFQFGSQAKKSVSFNKDKAINFFKSHKLYEAIKTVETVDEVAVEKYIAEGEISFEDLESITDTRTSYAVFCKPKEEMPEVEEVPLKSVASVKSRFKGRK